MKKVMIVLIVILILFIPPIGVAAQGSADGQIEGQVKIEPDGEGDLSDLEVTITWFSGSESKASYGTKTDDDGAFRFSNLETDPSYTYFVTVHYEGSEFHSSAITFESGETIKSIEITVFPFDAGDDDLDYLFAAFAIVWVVIFGYIIFLRKRHHRLKKDIENMQKLLSKK